jgi:hypothetical protein
MNYHFDTFIYTHTKKKKKHFDKYRFFLTPIVDVQ